MTRKELVSRAIALVFIACLVVTQATDASACGYWLAPAQAASGSPDLPIEPFVGGHLGVLQSSYSRKELVLAYRWLRGYGLSSGEQSAVLQMWEQRVPGSTRHTAAAVTDDALARWNAARERALGPSSSVATGAYDPETYDYVAWCLPDAFVRAAGTLESKLASGTELDAARVWATAQDQVFAQCASPSAATIPTPLPTSARPALRHERDYQIASALFYARRYPEARAAFEAYGRGAPADDAALAQYLVARSQQRAGDLAGAERTLRALLADPTLRSRHAAASRYLAYVRCRSAPEAVRREAEETLARAGEVANLAEVLVDYALLAERIGTPTAAQATGASNVPSTPRTEGERLRSWVAVMQDPSLEAFERAYVRWQERPDAAWLVAALQHATDPQDPRVAPLLAAAAAIDRAHPAYVSVRFHRARLLARRTSQADRRVAYAEAEALRSALIADDGRSAYNEVRALAASLAPTRDAWARLAAAVPAVPASDDPTVVVPQGPLPPPSLAPDAAEMLADRVPLSTWVRLVESDALPRELVPQLTTTAYVRALLLGERATAARLAPRVRTALPPLATALDAIESAPDDDHRALATVMLLLQHPQLSPSPRAWGEQSFDARAIDTAYGNYGWCALTPASPAASPIFLGRAERGAAARERAALLHLGGSATYLAREATRLAALLPDDPRVPEALHLAVRLTRFGCRDATTSPASRAAFRALHARFAGSEWARRTRHYY